MNPAVWPPEVIPSLERMVTVEYATLTRAGTPVTVPTTPYPGETGETIDVSTGLTYPAKAERARQEPRVCLLFADPVGAGEPEPPVVLVQGLASVSDSDLQANTDRYVRCSMAKLPEATKGQPKAALRRMAWYYARIWVAVTPLHIHWWPSRALAEPAREWHAPEGTAAPLSDPPPPGRRPGAWIAPPSSWRDAAAMVSAPGALCDITVVDANGFPLCLPTTGATLVDDGIRLTIGPGAPAVVAGPACVTIHRHPERFTGQENRTIVGSAVPVDGGVHFVAERALADWSLAGNRARMAVGFLSKGRVLRRRLRDEAARRGQPVPTVRF